MDFRQARYFLAVVENEGINGAADALSVAQPTVSQALRSLERELGVQLFFRIGRGMVLSAAGRSLIGPSRQLLRDVTAVEDMLAADDGEVAGRLDIAAFPGLGTGEFLDLVARYRGAYPKVSVRISDLRGESSSAGVIRDGHSEFVLAHLPVEGGDGLDVIELGSQEYWLVYPPGTELPEGTVRLAELPDIPMVFVPRGGSLGDAIEAGIRDSGARPPIAVLTEHREARLPLVLAGVGGSLVERSVAELAKDRVVVRRCEPSFTRAFGLVFNAGALSPVGQAFVDLVRDHRAGRTS
ncbi:LysR family transcriptional regulator [Tomitella biformata]|uniref:LysR family transcriptional regulator n=1 Tax=Tomitella biformata TaxID=630403 RepID=UPI000464E9AA|nr:LysR family transcriptional regulator [Tomitella biformata]